MTVPTACFEKEACLHTASHKQECRLWHSTGRGGSHLQEQESGLMKKCFQQAKLNTAELEHLSKLTESLDTGRESVYLLCS